MRILILNWKDIKHPQSGGAEYATQLLAQELVNLKHQVTLFTSHHKHLKTFEKIKGVNIFRDGNSFSVYWKAYIHYNKNIDKYDIVIDQIHGIPFYAPLYVKQPILAYIHEVAGPIWFKEFIFPVALLGVFIEKLYFIIYRKIYFLTDTKSASLELQKNKINKKQVFVLPLTINPHPLLKLNKSKTPLIIYIGRITPMKQIDIFIKSAKIMIEQIPNLQIVIAGKSKKGYADFLSDLCSRLKLTKNIKFLENITNVMKYKLYRKSWIQIHPSIKEGFGLTILEAATQATPTIGFAVPGIQDNIINGVNGLLIKTQTPEKLAESIINLIKNKNKLIALQNSTYNWSKKILPYSKQVLKLEKILYRLIK